MKHQLNIISELMNLWINEANDCWCWMKTKGIGEARWPSATRNQFQSSLPNGKIELMWFVAADGALMGMELLKWDWIYWWVKGAAAPRQPANKEDELSSGMSFFFWFVELMNEFMNEINSNKSIKRWDWRMRGRAGAFFVGLWVMSAERHRQQAKKED